MIEFVSPLKEIYVHVNSNQINFTQLDKPNSANGVTLINSDNKHVTTNMSHNKF